MVWGHRRRLGDYVRFEVLQNLFYDQLLDEDIRILLSLSSGEVDSELHVRFTEDRFEFQNEAGTPPFARIDYDALGSRGQNPKAHDIKFFRFKDSAKYDDKEAGSLNAPHGSNLFSVVFASKILRDSMMEFFRKYGLKLVLKPQEKVFELQKQAEDLVFSFPYALTSDTLRRIIFYTIAIASNKDSVLVFEEPESNAFPYYTKYLGERIALDKTNQFFIATHNPYLLSAVIEKARKEDVQVFITYFKDFQTLVKPLTPDEVVELMEADPFFNLDRFIEAAE